MKKSLVLSTIFCLVTRCNVSCIIGSYAAHFSALAFAGPIIGLHAPFSLMTISWGGFCLWTLLHSHTVNFMMLVYHIPSFMGMVYANLTLTNHTKNSFQKARSSIIVVLIPMVCIFLFCLHPVGSQAWFYALLWIFPCVFPLIKRTSFFWQALASTLTCHAVGSVLWLHTHSLTASQWLQLIPITILERIIIASAATILYYLVEYITHKDWIKISLWIKLKSSPYIL